MAPSDRTPSRRDVLRTAGAGIVGGLAATGTVTAADGDYTMEFFEDRMYRKYVPPNLGDSGERPLLVVLHGCGEDPHTIKEITGYNELADDEEFVVIYPEQPWRPTPTTAGTGSRTRTPLAATARRASSPGWPDRSSTANPSTPTGST